LKQQERYLLQNDVTVNSSDSSLIKIIPIVTVVNEI
jgi:hypothetical protein